MQNNRLLVFAEKERIPLESQLVNSPPKNIDFTQNNGKGGDKKYMRWKTQDRNTTLTIWSTQDSALAYNASAVA